MGVCVRIYAYLLSYYEVYIFFLIVNSLFHSGKFLLLWLGEFGVITLFHTLDRAGLRGADGFARDTPLAVSIASSF